MNDPPSIQNVCLTILDIQYLRRPKPADIRLLSGIPKKTDRAPNPYTGLFILVLMFQHAVNPVCIESVMQFGLRNLTNPQGFEKGTTNSQILKDLVVPLILVRAHTCNKVHLPRAIQRLARRKATFPNQVVHDPRDMYSGREARISKRVSVKT